jgi:Beta propeller domain
MRSRLVRGLVGLVALGASAAAVAAAPRTTTGAGPPRAFRSCGELLAYAKAHATQITAVGGFGLPSGVVAAPAAAPVTRSAGDDFSTTNVQEAGVDEPDIVKSDGTRIFAVAGNTLYALDARAAKPHLLGSLTLPQGTASELLLYKTKLLVLGSADGVLPGPVIARPAVYPYLPSKAVLTEVDVHDPAAMQVLRTLTVDGSYLAARQVGATARIVVSSLPRVLPVTGGGSPIPTPTPQSIASSGVRAWLPSAVLRDRRSGRSTTRALVQCRAVRHPPRFSGVGMVTILTVDLARGLPAVDSDALMTGSGAVYASADALYLASQSWYAVPLAGSSQPRPTGITTEIDKFDTSRPDSTTYEARGMVPGFLLNQWAMSEYEGNLRVAATNLPLWWNTPQQPVSETAVHVLAQRGGDLIEIGHVDGLGRGERVYAVRFMGPTGYVVTFRQVDPLYTLDLGDPTNPRVLGTLELLGYSAYLHPIGNDRLLGVGQDATPEGRLLGTRLTLFDVSNLRRPARLDASRLGLGSSEVEYDPHAFLYWPADALAVVPVQIVPAAPAGGSQFTGAIAFHVGRNGITELARITHPVAEAAIRRSLVVGNRLFTLSDSGVEASSLTSFADLAWIPFG